MVNSAILATPTLLSSEGHGVVVLFDLDKQPVDDRFLHSTIGVMSLQGLQSVVAERGRAGVKIPHQFTESLWIAFQITCQLIACQKFFWRGHERMQKSKAVEKITMRWLSIQSE